MTTQESQMNNQSESTSEDTLGEGDKSLILKQPIYWARAITWSLMGITIFGVSWLSIAKTEEIVTVTGKLEPLGVVKDVQVPVGGVVDKILVKDGEKVKQGQTVLRLDAEATTDKKLSIEKNIQYTNHQF